MVQSDGIYSTVQTVKEIHAHHRMFEKQKEKDSNFPPHTFL